jgi:homocitrate synthase
MARMIVADREYVTSKYNIKALKEVEDLVADLVEVNIPFNVSANSTTVQQ